MSPVWLLGQQSSIRLDRLTQDQHDELWQRLRAHQDDSELGVGVRHLMATELLVFGRYFTDDDLIKPAAKPAAKKKGRKRKNDAENYTGYF